MNTVPHNILGSILLVALLPVFLVACGQEGVDPAADTQALRSFAAMVQSPQRVDHLSEDEPPFIPCTDRDRMPISCEAVCPKGEIVIWGFCDYNDEDGCFGAILCAPEDDETIYQR